MSSGHVVVSAGRGAYSGWRAFDWPPPLRMDSISTACRFTREVRSSTCFLRAGSTAGTDGADGAAGAVVASALAILPLSSFLSSFSLPLAASFSDGSSSPMTSASIFMADLKRSRRFFAMRLPYFCRSVCPTAPASAFWMTRFA